MNKNLLEYCLDKGILLDSETGELVNDFDEKTAKEFIEKISNLNEKMITKSVLIKNIDRVFELIDDNEVIEKLKINLDLSLEITKKHNRGLDKEASDNENNINNGEKDEKVEEKEDNENLENKNEEDNKKFELGNLKILKNVYVKEDGIEPNKFVVHFRNRYSKFKRILRNRKELSNLTSIDKLSSERSGCSVIGMVYSKRKTKNDNILIELEDLTGKVRVLFNKDKDELYDEALDILPDDIIGVRGFGDNEIIFANDMVYPEAALSEKNSLELDENVAFISDIHMGSTFWLKENFEKFIKWLNGEVGNEKQKKIAKNVKYLLINGDSVDGVGIFPDQDELLEIDDIYKQYEKVAEYLGRIREDIKIVISPGQHDAVWLGQPQPPIEKEYAKPLYELDNVVMVSNPAMVEINDGKRGFSILMFHGASMNDVINNMESLKMGSGHEHPAEVVKHLLKRRHLAPLHSAVDYIPHREDHLFIDKVPNVITTADFHRPEIDEYNKIRIISNSCWQRQTPFEEKVGNQPDPCKVPILNLKSQDIKIMDFSGGESHKKHSGKEEGDEDEKEDNTDGKNESEEDREENNKYNNERKMEVKNEE